MASLSLRLAGTLRPSLLTLRLRGTHPRTLSDRERAAFIEALGILHGIDISERALTLEALASVDDHVCSALVEEARELLEGKFVVFGRTVRTDPRHPDWHVDFTSGHRFPALIPCELLHPADYPGGYDIIVPWEFSRFHFGTRLAQAYWLTGDEEYAVRVGQLITDWIRSNPVGMGVNWVAGMDASIRAINWAMALKLVSASPSLPEAFWDLVHESLLVHARWIGRGIGAAGSTRHKNNHFMTSLVGLVVLGSCCQSPEADVWYELGLRSICDEIARQVNSDGGHFEDSPCYHRLVTELVLIALGTARQRGDGARIPESVQTRLESMLECMLDYTRPDGSCPNYGDADSGRALILGTEDYTTNVTCHLDTVALGALMQGRADLLNAAGNACISAAWAYPSRLLGARRSAAAGALRSTTTGLLRPETGTAILRSEAFHAIVKCGANGQSGLGGHSHNDKLSLELSDEMGPLLVDSGTGVYTSDYLLRGHMRGTAAHNTLQLGGTEQNAFDAARAFGFLTDGAVRILHWTASDESEVFAGEFAGYDSLHGKPVHRRLVLLDRVADVLVIDDAVVSEGPPVGPCTLSWHFAPRAHSLVIHGAELAVSFEGGAPLHLSWQPCCDVAAVDPAVEECTYSERYRMLLPASVLRLRFVVQGKQGLLRTIVDRGVSDEAVRCATARAGALRELLLAPRSDETSVRGRAVV